jgi:hypothetical protein
MSSIIIGMLAWKRDIYKLAVKDFMIDVFITDIFTRCNLLLINIVLRSFLKLFYYQ